MNISHEKDNNQQTMFVNSIKSSMPCVSRHSKKMEKKIKVKSKYMKKTPKQPPPQKTKKTKTKQNQPTTTFKSCENAYRCQLAKLVERLIYIYIQ